MRFRLIKNQTSIFLLPTIAITWSKIWYGHRDISITWLVWYLSLEWGYEN
jgi:hypothetical protein